MDRLNELASRLTPAQLTEVEDFAAFLGTRRDSAAATAADRQKSQFVDVDGLTGLCKGMGGDRSGKELVRESWDGIVAKHDS